MTANRNPETNIPYGIIRADSIESSLFDDLCYKHGKDTHYDSALADHLAQKRREFDAVAEELAIKRAETGEDRENPNIGEDDPEFDEDYERDQFAEDYQSDEPRYAGEHEGVHYQTTWIGGAPHLYVFKSPVLTKCRPCSPCVPHAGDLDSTGDYLAYGVPVTWLEHRFIEELMEKDGFKIVLSGDGKEYWMPKHDDDGDFMTGPFGDMYEAGQDWYKKTLQFGVGMTLEQIKAAINAGKSVHWANQGYKVIKGRYEYLICYYDKNAIGLTHQDGVTMNGREDQFFTTF